MPSYVVLHHQLGESDHLTRQTQSHFDWMFEHNDALWTWATDSHPGVDEVAELVANRLPDHRKHYLSYEGVVSGDRGHVTRVESGIFEIVESADDRFQFKLCGMRVATLTIQRNCSAGNLAAEVDRWYASFLPTRVEAS
jgi:hypothetical protein